MTKVGCVFYYKNSVSSCKNGTNEPNMTKIGLSSDEKQTQTLNVSWHIWQLSRAEVETETLAWAIAAPAWWPCIQSS